MQMRMHTRTFVCAHVCVHVCVHFCVRLCVCVLARVAAIAINMSCCPQNDGLSLELFSTSPQSVVNHLQCFVEGCWFHLKGTVKSLISEKTSTLFMLIKYPL